MLSLAGQPRKGADGRDSNMSLMLNISNRQRSCAVDQVGTVKLAEKLAAAVFADLIAHPGKVVPPRLARELGSREREAVLSLVLVSNRQIRQLNKEWRDKDAATDVLSFPLELVPPPAGLPWEIGEVFISLPKAQEQAKEYGHSFKRELAFLFVHGLLHILGFDHLTKAQEKDMFGRQKRILEACGIMRSSR